MKTFVIGDIHGCFQELKALIEKMAIKWGEDRLVFLGDYIDRGNEEHEVLELLQNLLDQFGPDKIIPLMGNHEQMHLDSVDSGRACSDRFSERDMAFLRNRPVYFEDESWFYVHGGVNPLKDFTEQDEDEMLWIRETFYNFSGRLQKKVAFGHTPTRLIHGQDVPVVRSDRVALDTGCVFGGRLSAMELLNGEIITIHSVDKIRPERHGSAA